MQGSRSLPGERYVKDANLYSTHNPVIYLFILFVTFTRKSKDRILGSVAFIGPELNSNLDVLGHWFHNCVERLGWFRLPLGRTLPFFPRPVFSWRFKICSLTRELKSWLKKKKKK